MDRPTWKSIALRLVFVTGLAALGASMHPFNLTAGPAALCGFLFGCCGVVVEASIRRSNLTALAAAGTGMFVGGLLGLVAVGGLSIGPAIQSSTAQFFRIAAPLLGCYVGLLAGIAKSDLFDLGMLGANSGLASALEKILDTSVLIDGRIADIAESGFIDGKLIIPQFVLHELQLVADSPDSARRNRGRRGLDVVQRMQKMPGVRVDVTGQDFPAVKEVDLKLIELAKLRLAKIVTNDFNLNKLAQVQGVDVLNINELANALKPVVLPGEAMRVFILKEGKEYNQGVAYLDDGTMVVVDNARRLISKTIDITVTSVLQTTAGKMIFGKYDERAQALADQRGGMSATASAGNV